MNYQKIKNILQNVKESETTYKFKKKISKLEIHELNSKLLNIEVEYLSDNAAIIKDNKSPSGRDVDVFYNFMDQYNGQVQ